MTQNALTFGALAMLGLFGVMTIASRFFKWRGAFTATGKGRTVTIRETLAVDPKRRLHLVEWQDGTVLLLTGGQQDIVIGRARGE